MTDYSTFLGVVSEVVATITHSLAKAFHSNSSVSSEFVEDEGGEEFDPNWTDGLIYEPPTDKEERARLMPEFLALRDKEMLARKKAGKPVKLGTKEYHILYLKVWKQHAGRYYRDPSDKIGEDATMASSSQRTSLPSKATNNSSPTTTAGNQQSKPRSASVTKEFSDHVVQSAGPVLDQGGHESLLHPYSVVVLSNGFRVRRSEFRATPTAASLLAEIAVDCSTVFGVVSQVAGTITHSLAKAFHSSSSVSSEFVEDEGGEEFDPNWTDGLIYEPPTDKEERARLMPEFLALRDKAMLARKKAGRPVQMGTKEYHILYLKVWKQHAGRYYRDPSDKIGEDATMASNEQETLRSRVTHCIGSSTVVVVGVNDQTVSQSVPVVEVIAAARDLKKDE